MFRGRVLVVGMALAVCASGLACRQPSSPDRSLVVISIDTLARARMSTYGAERRTTPHIDALAARALRFTRAYSASPWTLPAHATMLTGRWPGSLADDTHDLAMLRTTETPLLAETLRAEGFRTGAFTGGGFMSEGLGVERGFEVFHEAGVDRAVAWLEEHVAERFFLFFHTFVVHMPYRDRRFAEDLPSGRLAGVYGEADERAGYPLHEAIAFGKLTPTEEERVYVQALYDGGVAAADEAVGVLLAALARLHLIDRTIVVVTSDHGEEFWQHGGRGAYHGHTLYDELLGIPLIWFEPGLPAAGRTTDAQVTLADVVPTLCRRLAVDCPTPMDGEDLSTLLAGRDWVRAAPVYAEAVRNGPPRYSVRTRAAKLILTPDASIQNAEGARAPVPVRAAEELYLADDPEERVNRIDDAPAVAARLRGLLQDRVPTGSGADSAGGFTVDSGTRARLRELGYVLD